MVIEHPYAEVASTTDIRWIDMRQSRPGSLSPSAFQSFTTNASIASEFARLSSEWRSATRVMSLSAQRSAHPAFARLVALGDNAIPMVLAEVEKGHLAWLEVLATIAGDRGPMLTDEQLASRSAVAEAWVAWGRKNPN